MDDRHPSIVMGSHKKHNKKHSYSSNESSEDDQRKNKRKKHKSSHKSSKKKKKLLQKQVSSSSDTSTSSSSPSTDSEEERRKVTKLKRLQKKKSKEKSSDIPLHLMEKSKAMAPMTKEEWEKSQSVVRRVYDERTGRQRLIKGDGEVIEEIVSRDRHKAINQQATRGDGDFFQAKMANYLKK